MKIAFVTTSVSRNAGGLYDAVRYLAQAVNDSAAQVTIFGTWDKFTTQDIGGWHPLEVNTFSILGPERFAFCPGMGTALWRSDCDVLIHHGLWQYPSISTMHWHQRTGRPIIINPHGMLDPWAVSNSRWKKRMAAAFFERKNLEHASCFRALCLPEAQAVRSYGLKQPLCVIPNGINLPDLTHPPADPPPWQGSVSAEQRVILYLGRLHPKKNLPALIKAWQLVRGREGQGRDWTLVIAGWDELGHGGLLRTMAMSDSSGASIHFTGPLYGAVKVAAHRHATAFVLPSLSEGLPMSILEAWAYGLPVLISPQCNLPEGFRHKAAIRVEPSVLSIAEGLRQMFAISDADRRTMGGRGRRLVEEQFSWPRIAAQFKEVIAWSTGGARPEFLHDGAL